MDYQNNFDCIIDDYLNPYTIITKKQIDILSQVENCKHFKIINNHLYIDNKLFNNIIYKPPNWESRIEAFKYMILSTLKQYKINDVEFVMYDDDGINESNIDKFKMNYTFIKIAQL